MTQEKDKIMMDEMDQKEFEKEWERNISHVHAECLFWWLASRRLLRENQNKGLDFLDDKGEDIYTESDGTKVGEKEGK